MRFSSANNVGQVASVVLCLLTAANALGVISTPQTLSNASAIVNATVLDTKIDSRFRIRADYGITKIPSTPCLMNVVELMAQYAERDWLSRVGDRHGVVLPGYPQVEIAILATAPATTIENRVVVWGLWTSITSMINRNLFVEAEFELLWEDKVVASIYYTGPLDSKATDSNGTLDTDVPLTPLPSSDSVVGDILDTTNGTQDSLGPLNDGTFSWLAVFPPNAKTLTVIEVFLTVFSGLRIAAPPAASDKVPGPFAAAADGVNANLQFYLHKRRLPRPLPPYFQYIHIIKSLKMVPAYMLEKKRFAEFFFSMEVSGVTVGEGYLEKGRYTPPLSIPGDMLGPEFNVSIS